MYRVITSPLVGKIYDLGPVLQNLLSWQVKVSNIVVLIVQWQRGLVPWTASKFHKESYFGCGSLSLNTLFIVRDSNGCPFSIHSLMYWWDSWAVWVITLIEVHDISYSSPNGPIPNTIHPTVWCCLAPPGGCQKFCVASSEKPPDLHFFLAMARQLLLAW